MLRKQYPEETEKQMKSFFDSLNERDRRRYAAIEAIKLGHGQYLRIISGFCIRQANINDKSRIVPVFCCGVTINGSLLIH